MTPAATTVGEGEEESEERADKDQVRVLLNEIIQTNILSLVSDVVKPQLDELSVATSVVNEAFECEDEKKDLESVIDIEPSTLSYLIERRRLSTIDENLDSPNLTLASHKNVEQKQHIKFLFDEAEEEAYNQEVINEVQKEIYNRKEFLLNEVEEEIYNQEVLVNGVDNPDNSDEEVSNSGKFTSPIFV